jgi:hypothetical protein
MSEHVRAMERRVILREVAGSTLGNDVAAGVDSATARGMTCLEVGSKPRRGSPDIGEQWQKARFLAEGGLSTN